MLNLASTHTIKLFKIHMKNQLNYSFFKMNKGCGICCASGIHIVQVFVFVVFYATNIHTLVNNVVNAIFNLYLEILHKQKSPLCSELCCRRGQLQLRSIMKRIFEKKKPPQRFDPLVLLLTRWRGRHLARSLSKGVALLHQGVYYDSCTPCETEVVSPSAISGWSV